MRGRSSREAFMRKNASPEGRPVLGTLPAAASKHLIAFVVEVIEFQV
jgi:hypothetical protein